MAEKRGKKRPFGQETIKEEEMCVANDVPSDAAVLSVQEAKVKLRERWELASVLNFLQVFRPVIQDDLKISGEQIEESLIRPNGVLARIHVALLKGIPPVSRNLGTTDAWVTALCKKINTWWPWVAEGELPLIAKQGAEIARYKEFDPVTRLVILKALCEIRSEQDDIVGYMEDTLKKGTPLSTFRKDRIGTCVNGTSYWFDGDPDLGYRLYREIILVDPIHRSKVKGSLTLPVIDFVWETLATDIEEFREISAQLSDSKDKEEIIIGNVIKNDIMPIVEKLQKKRERLLKRQQRETILLTCSLGGAIGNRRSCRDRRPANYTFDDFDRSIREAIQIENKSKTAEMPKNYARKIDGENKGSLDDTKIQAALEGTTNDRHNSVDSNEGSKNGDDYEVKNEEDYDDDYNSVADDSDQMYDSDDYGKESNSSESDKEAGNHANNGNGGSGPKSKYGKVIPVEGLRRSSRTTGTTHTTNLNSNAAIIDNRLKNMPVHGVDHEYHVVPDSENESDKEQSSLSPDNTLAVQRDGIILTVK